MKKILLCIVAAFAVSACATYVPYQKATYTTFLDYRPYTTDGIYLSPDPYMDKCENLGEISIEVYPEQVKIENGLYGLYDEVAYYGKAWYGFERISYAELLQTAVERAKKVGANGVVSLKIQKHFGSRPFYTVTGLCIKK